MINSKDPFALIVKAPFRSADYLYDPKPDITAYEMALLIPIYNGLVVPSRMEEFFDTRKELFDVDLRRHFRKLL